MQQFRPDIFDPSKGEPMHWAVGKPTGSGKSRSPMQESTRYAMLVALAVIAVVGVIWFLHEGTKATLSLTVNDKYIKRVGESDLYMVATNKGVFKVSDAPLSGRFNSADQWAALKTGASYACNVNGVRLPVLSQYKNILSCK